MIPKQVKKKKRWGFHGTEASIALPIQLSRVWTSPLKNELWNLTEPGLSWEDVGVIVTAPKLFIIRFAFRKKRSFCWSCFHSRNRGSILQRTVSRHDKPQHSEKQILILSTHKTHTRKRGTDTDIHTRTRTRTRTHAHALTLPELRVW